MVRVPATLLLSALLWGCSEIAVHQDYDVAVDFQGLKTYAWRTPPGEEPRGGLDANSLMGDRIRKAVDAALSEKGYKKAPAGKADELVDYRYAVDEEPAPERARAGIGLGMGSGGVFGSLGVGLGGGEAAYERETLTIDVLGPRDGKLLWRGSAERRLERTSDPREAAARIDKTVRAILSKFPPKPGGS